MGVPYEPVRWQPTSTPLDDERRHRLVKQVHVQTLINMYRVRGHLIAHLDPLDGQAAAQLHPELDPATYGLTIWDLDREFVADGLAGHDVMTLGDILDVLRDAYCRTLGVEYMHIQEPDQKRWIQQHVEGVSTGPDPRGAAPHPRAGSTRPRRSSASSTPGTSARSGSASRGRSRPSCCSTPSSTRRPRAGIGEAVLGMAHRGRLNVLANIVGKSYGEIFEEFEGNLDPALDPGLRRREVPQGRHRQVRRPVRGRRSPSRWRPTPRHLEAVDPVVEGMVRAKQDSRR